MPEKYSEVTLKERIAQLDQKITKLNQKVYRETSGTLDGVTVAARSAKLYTYSVSNLATYINREFELGVRFHNLRSGLAEIDWDAQSRIEDDFDSVELARSYKLKIVIKRGVREPYADFAITSTRWLDGAPRQLRDLLYVEEDH